MSEMNIEFKKPCPKCGYNKWQTLEKKKKWRCRVCRVTREYV